MMSDSEWDENHADNARVGEISQVIGLMIGLIIWKWKREKNSQKNIRNWLSREKMYKEEGYRNDWNASKFFGKFFFSQVDDIDIF